MKYASFIFLLFLVSCVGQKYAPPSMNLPKQWCHPVCDTKSPACFKWWMELNDPLLCTLVNQAEHCNLDLKIAKLISEEKGTCQACNDYKIALNNVRVEVVGTYINLKGLLAKLELLKRGIQIQEQSLSLTQDLLGKGDVTSFDIQMIQGQIALLNAQIPTIQIGIAKMMHHLSVTLGMPPCALQKVLCQNTAIAQLPSCCMIGTPCELIKRRPDVNKAACDYMDASQLGLCSYQAREALASYNKTVLLALEESENALITFKNQKIKAQELKRAYQLALEASQTAHELFDRGLKSSLELVATDQGLLKAETELLEANLEFLHAYVDLYRSLAICL